MLLLELIVEKGMLLPYSWWDLPRGVSSTSEAYLALDVLIYQICDL